MTNEHLMSIARGIDNRLYWIRAATQELRNAGLIGDSQAQALWKELMDLEIGGYTDVITIAESLKAPSDG